jgi:hypothetical protein
MLILAHMPQGPLAIGYRLAQGARSDGLEALHGATR